jgi:hypothetical protein
MSKGTPVFVACDGIRLKLTCTPELLSKPFAECLVTPFLGAFNKKRNTSFEAAALAKVEVNGSVISDLSLSGTAVLDASVKTDEAPSVVLHLPKGGAGTAEACVAAVAAVLALDPKIATSEEASDALRLLRDALKATPTAAEPALTPRVVGAVADFALLTAAAAERPWSAASAEATAALNNLLAASREKAGALLCAPEVGAIARIVAIFEASTETPLPRLKLLSPILFHLSLLPAISAHAEPLGAAARHALVSVCDSLCVAGLIDETTGASLAEDLIRSSFNLIRVSPPTSVAVDDLVSAVRTLLRSPAEPGTERATALDEAKRTALQVCEPLSVSRTFRAPDACPLHTHSQSTHPAPPRRRTTTAAHPPLARRSSWCRGVLCGCSSSWCCPRSAASALCTPSGAACSTCSHRSSTLQRSPCPRRCPTRWCCLS